MRTLESYGVQEMDTQEIENINGGFVFILGVLGGIIGGVIVCCLDDTDGFSQGFKDGWE